jgi:hypothetical protein
VAAGALYLYRVAGDAWTGGLQAWCEAARERAGESWILVANAGQARWFARKLGGEEMQRLRIFDAAEMRAELARVADVAPIGEGNAVAAFFVKTVTGRPRPDARPLTAAAEELARAGWYLNKLETEQPEAQRLQRALSDYPLLPGFFEREIRKAVPTKIAHLCCVGWDAAQWRELALLDLAVHAAGSVEMYVPAPRLPADALQREWIETLEERYGLARQVCAASEFESRNDALVSRLEKSGLGAGEVAQPLLIVGREWEDEVGLVCETVLRWVKEKERSGPIGIVGAEKSPTARAVARALAGWGLKVETPGRAMELSSAKLIAEQIARYHLNDRDVMEFAELARLLWMHGGKRWKALEPAGVQDALERAFRTAQTRNSRILMQAQPWLKDGLWITLGELAEMLGRWDAEVVRWITLRDKWSALCEAFELSPDAQWREVLNRVFVEEQIGDRDFFEFILECAGEERRRISRPDYMIRAQVVVTKFADAAQQDWGGLIFLDSTEGAWRIAQEENRFLTDAMRARLNANRKEAGRLLTMRDARLIEEARFLELLEHCRGEIGFAGALLEQTESGAPAQPNEWVLRTLLETAHGKSPIELWNQSARTSAPNDGKLALAERKHLEIVHSSRRNGTMPFDRYQFDFNEARLDLSDDLFLIGGAWSVTDLDSAITCPATFALKKMFGAERAVWWSPARIEKIAVGNRVHRWLGHALGQGAEFSDVPSARDAERRLAQAAGASRRELEEWFASENLPLPLWWETCLRRAQWAARRCLREVLGAIDGGLCAVELNIKVAVETPLGTVPLKGRMDLVLSDKAELRDANVRIYDFKTGRGDVPSMKSLENGKGWQFAAYYLMARDAGAATASIGIVRSEGQPREVFGRSDEDDLRAHAGHFAELRRRMRFGRRGPLISEHGTTETLPLATTPIEKTVLEQKSALYLLAT